MELRWTTICERLQRLLETKDEPLSAYLYDLEALRQHATQVVNALPPGCELYYAIKANSDLPILRTLAPLVHGFEVSSGGELAWVRQYFADVPIIFSGPGKTDQELAQALRLNVGAIHVESRGELERLALLARTAEKEVPVLLRVNLPVQGLVSTTLMMGGGPTPFGIPVDQLPACLDWLQVHPELRIRGFHFHLLSHQLDAAAHLALLDAYMQQAAQWSRDYGLEIDHVNVGGGIGINYRTPGDQFDWDTFSSGLPTLVDKWKSLARIRFECGRYLTAACGYYAMQVIDIKQAFGRHYVVARGGTHQFRTPYAQGHSHPFCVMPVAHWPYAFTRGEIQAAHVTVVGQLCTPKDVLAFDAPIEQVRCGDMLIFSYAGAYAWHISHHDFLRHPHPEHHYLPVEEVIDADHQ